MDFMEIWAQAKVMIPVVAQILMYVTVAATVLVRITKTKKDDRFVSNGLPSSTKSELRSGSDESGCKLHSDKLVY